jgi:DNA-binding PadR family transcriptional regulator
MFRREHELRHHEHHSHDHDPRRFAFGRPPFGGVGPGFGPGFGPPFGGGRGGHGRGRGRRGNTRAAVLGLLQERPMHGYEMITELESRTGGVWRPSPGSIYPTLQLLEDEGLIVSEEAEGRKRFSLTEAGQAEAAKTTERPWHGLDAEQLAEAQDFRQAGFAIMQALQQVGMSGTAAQKQQALEVLTDTRRRLYAILAE